MPTTSPPGATETRVNPPLTYPGNKAKHASTIIENMPDHETYIEVFGGTAGVLFNKKPSRNEVINDADADLHTFLSVLKQRPCELQEWLSNRPYSEHEYKDLRGTWHRGWRPEDDVERAGTYFYLRRASFGSDLGGFRAEADGRRYSPRQFSNAINRLEDLSDRLQDVLLLNRDFEDVITKYGNSQNALLYMDPPYKHELHHYKDGLFERGRFAEVLADITGGDIYDGDWHEQDPAYWMLSCATIPISIEDLPFPTLELDCSHHINNRDGVKRVSEKLVMNFDINDCERFSGDSTTTQATLRTSNPIA